MSDYIYNHVKFKSATIIPLVSKYISCTDLFDSQTDPRQQFNHPPLCHCSWLFYRLSFGASLNCNNSSCLSLKVHFELLLKFFIHQKHEFSLYLYGFQIGQSKMGISGEKNNNSEVQEILRGLRNGISVHDSNIYNNSR